MEPIFDRPALATTLAWTAIVRIAASATDSLQPTCVNHADTHRDRANVDVSRG